MQSFLLNEFAGRAKYKLRVLMSLPSVVVKSKLKSPPVVSFTIPVDAFQPRTIANGQFTTACCLNNDDGSTQGADRLENQGCQ